jgi:hypothetical protein
MPSLTAGQQNPLYTQESYMNYNSLPVSCTAHGLYEMSTEWTIDWEKSRMKYDYQSATKTTMKSTDS